MERVFDSPCGRHSFTLIELVRTPDELLVMRDLHRRARTLPFSIVRRYVSPPLLDPLAVTVRDVHWASFVAGDYEHHRPESNLFAIYFDTDRHRVHFQMAVGMSRALYAKQLARETIPASVYMDATNTARSLTAMWFHSLSGYRPSALALLFAYMCRARRTPEVTSTLANDADATRVWCTPGQTYTAERLRTVWRDLHTYMNMYHALDAYVVRMRQTYVMYARHTREVPAAAPVEGEVRLYVRGTRSDTREAMRSARHAMHLVDHCGVIVPPFIRTFVRDHLVAQLLDAPVGDTRWIHCIDLSKC